MYHHSRYNKIILVILLVLLLWPQTAQAYIGPGAGFAVVGSFLVMLTAMLSAILAMFTWPIRYFFRAIKGRKAFAKSSVKKFIILGLDGLEPTLADKFLAEGKLPNLAKLSEQGCYKRLGTTLPPLSPVAWSSFQTGCNPGKHNIFDFLTRNKNNYLPQISSVEINPPKRMLRLGKFQIPLGGQSIRLLRKAIPFWKILGDHGIFSNILRVPITFPPEKFYGVSLSAMCVPDLRGSQGTFSFYSTQKESEREQTGGETFVVQRNNQQIKTHLVGPPHPFSPQKTEMHCPFKVVLNGHPNQATLVLNGQKIKLQQDVYTEWTEVVFKVAPGIKVRGICQFLLQETEPDFKLYVTPIHISPKKPAMPISHPNIFSTYLSKLQGPFATLGLAEDSWALNEKVLDEKGFLHQCVIADEEREKMYFDALDKVKRGVCVCVFDGTDRIQHTFWRYLDSEHPANNALKHEKNEKVIEELYQRMDGIVGETMEKHLDDDTVFMVISDHGFNSFRYGLDLNRWLEENGYLHLDESQRGKDYLAGVDWSRTKAYAIGLAGIYLNIKGREAQGIVEPGPEAEALIDEIIEKLTGMKHPQNGQVAVIQVYDANKAYKGPYKKEASDLIIGYNKGYRVSWETAIGKMTERVFHDNIKAWSGDHCIDPSLVPGVIFCNRKIEQENLRLMDIAPTVLEMFGVDVPAHMDGKPLKVQEHINE